MYASCAYSKAVFTVVTWAHYLDVGVKVDIEPNGGSFDVSPENDRASLTMKTPLGPHNNCVPVPVSVTLS